MRISHILSTCTRSASERLIEVMAVPKAPLSCSVSLVGNQRVTVNNGSLNQVSSPSGGHVTVTPLVNPAARPVSVTVLRSGSSMSGLPLPVTQTSSARVPFDITAQQRQRMQGQHTTFVSIPPLNRVLVKAVLKGENKDGKIFTLRNVDTTIISSCDDLKKTIKQQLCEDIVADDFDVGYVDGSSIVRLCNKEDLVEAWSGLRKPGSKMTLWCDGLIDRSGRKTDSRKRVRSDDVGSESELAETRPSKRKQPAADREEKVQEIANNLKEIHSSRYTPMQIRIWAEMMASGMHSSVDDHPNTSMFLRAGGGTPNKKKQQATPVAQALTDAATAIASALSPRAVPVSSSVVSGVGTSPAKVIENRSKLYKQLAELQNLRSLGVLTEDECKAEKETIMKLLHQLKAK